MKENMLGMNGFPINGFGNLKIKKCQNCEKQFVSRTEICPFCRTSPKKCFVSFKYILIISSVVLISVFGMDFFNENSNNKNDLTHEDTVNQKEDRTSSDIPGSIEKHYTQLVNNYNAGNFNLAIKELNLFKKYNRIGYKDVDRIKNKLITHLDQKVRDVPVSEIFENLTMYQQLLELEPGNSRYKNKVSFYMKRYQNGNPKDNKNR